MTAAGAAPPGVPAAWYNVLADIPVELPPDLPSPHADGRLRPQLPARLVRQELSREREIPLPPEVAERLARWRPTPLRRARALEAALDTPARIYYKDESGNVSGSHKLNSAVPQAFFYARAGARCLTTGTGAGQWGTALAAAGAMFGLDVEVYMTADSFRTKPYRRVLMEALGARVHPVEGSLSAALAAALDAAQQEGRRFCTGSGETYALQHQTVIGQEAMAQLEVLGEWPHLVTASLGAGSNLGGTAFPFLGAAARGERPPVRVLADDTVS
jgi:tryptophan synthase beta chain